MADFSEFKAYQQAEEERRKNERTAQNVAYTAALQKAAPSWVKQNLGLRIRQEGLSKRDVEKAVVAFTRNTGRPPTVEEFDSSVPGFFDPKPDDTGSGFGRAEEVPVVSDDHPFKILTNGTKVGIEPVSILYDGFSWATQTITGLLTDKTDSNDTGWVNRSAGVCYLHGVLDDTGTITTCEIKWGGDLTSLSRITIEAATETTSSFHKDFVYPIGKLTNNSGAWTIEQWADRHLTLLDINYNGNLCRYPVTLF